MKSRNKFNVGDKVKVNDTSEYNKDFFGVTGIIQEDSFAPYIKMHFPVDEWEIRSFSEDDMELVESELISRSELITFLKANQKATVKQVLEHLNQMK